MITGRDYVISSLILQLKQQLSWLCFKPKNGNVLFEDGPLRNSIWNFYFENYLYVHLLSCLIHVLPHPRAQLIGREKPRGNVQELGGEGNHCRKSSVSLSTAHGVTLLLQCTLYYVVSAWCFLCTFVSFFKSRHMLDGSSQEYQSMLIVMVCGCILQQVWRLTVDCLTKGVPCFVLLCSWCGVSRLQNCVRRNSWKYSSNYLSVVLLSIPI